jgi:Z1 domain
MSALYLVKDGDRIVRLAVERAGKLYGYVPNVEEFVYNKSMTTDFLVDRDLSYEPISVDEATRIIDGGEIGRINASTNQLRLAQVNGENRRLNVNEVLATNDVLDQSENRTLAAQAKAAILQQAPPGTWITYHLYFDGSNRQAALQMASDLRRGKVRAFRGMAISSRVAETANGYRVVQISRPAEQKLEPDEELSADTLTRRTYVPLTSESIPMERDVVDPLYGVFAEHARKYGLEIAMDSFQGLPQRFAFRAQFEQDLARVEEGGPPIITAGRDDWYNGSAPQDRFWPELKKSWEAEGWPQERIEDIDTASSAVVGHTSRPSRPAWDTKGLVVGYVQSGKTTNFISVIAKLADVDYRMVIVLSGIHNGLRRQTQERVDEALHDLNPDKWFDLTDDNRDFFVPTLGTSAVLSSNKVAIAVIKKNQAVLLKLIEWLDKPEGRRALKTTPVLVIDDEADQASVATKTINPLIRRILGLMSKSTYVGYTATPFANVFISPDDDDLYPKSFILNLPRPKGYFGPEKLFGRDGVEGEDREDADGPADGYDMVRRVPEEDVTLLRPGSKEPAEDFVPKVTKELKDAVHWFWLATAVRRVRGDSGHSTMLIHTSVKTLVHESFRSPLEAMRAKALQDLQTGDVDALARWRELWDRESGKVPAADFGLTHYSFDDIAPLLPGVVGETTIVLDNYRSQDRLDYSGDPVVAIAVGGNTLSRGLTLAGLVVSFFIRAATAYDTLLQMGRWFGYRTGYEDLPRIWMTPSLESAFRHLATVEHEMRDDIDRYQRENLTPIEVAVRIKTHPSLRITAKMGAAQPAYISYAGRRLQTRYFFRRDLEWLNMNQEAAGHLVEQAAARTDPEPLGADGGAVKYVFRDVPVGLIKDFLSRYRVHSDSPDLDSALMIRYIDEQLAAVPPSLDVWSVAVVTGDGDEIRFGGIDVKAVRRSRLSDGEDERADIKTLMSKEDRALDLLAPSETVRKASEDALMKRRNEDAVYSRRGLLVLYPIDPISRPEKEYSEDPPPRVPLSAAATVVGFGIVFPGDVKSKSVRASYVAVDLTDVEADDLDDALTTDTEDPA